jgi:tellurite resistance protein
MEDTALQAEADQQEMRHKMMELATSSEQCQVATIQRSSEAGQAMRTQILRQVEQANTSAQQVITSIKTRRPAIPPRSQPERTCRSEYPSAPRLVSGV